MVYGDHFYIYFISPQSLVAVLKASPVSFVWCFVWSITRLRLALLTCIEEAFFRCEELINLRLLDCLRRVHMIRVAACLENKVLDYLERVIS